MEFMKYFKEALTRFENDLRTEEIRINKAVNDVAGLLKEKQVLQDEVANLKQEAKDLDANIDSRNEEAQKALDVLKADAEALRQQAQELLQEAMKERGLALADRNDAAKAKEEAVKQQQFWQEKTEGLKAVMGR